MLHTSNYDLKKPEPNDNYNVQDQNDNMDIIDAKLKVVEDATADGNVTDGKIGDRTINDANAPTGNTGKLTTILGWLANMIKAITGESSWRTMPGMTIKAIKTLLDAATPNATADSLVRRNASNQASFSTPTATGHAATKGYVDQRVDSAISASDNVQSALTGHVNNTTNPHNVTKTQIGLGSVENYGIATQAEAEAGTVNTKYMTPLRTKQEIDALTGGLKWRISNGAPEYWNGTEWVGVGASKILVPSTTVRSSRNEVVSMQIIFQEGANGKRKLAHKWTPKFDGEVTISVDMKRSVSSSTGMLNLYHNTSGRYTTGNNPIQGAVMLAVPAVGQSYWDYNTPIDTTTINTIAVMGTTTGKIEIAKLSAAALEPDYVNFTRNFSVFAGQTMFFVIEAPDQSAAPTMYIRNIQVKYDEVYL